MFSAFNFNVNSTPELDSNSSPQRKYLPIKKGTNKFDYLSHLIHPVGPYKSGWKKDEHLRFLKGLQMHGKGSWKEIAQIVGTRTPTQIQVQY